MTDEFWITGVGTATTLGVGRERLAAALTAPTHPAHPFMEGTMYPYAPLSGNSLAAPGISAVDVLDSCMDELLAAAAIPASLVQTDSGLVLGATAGLHRRWQPGSERHQYLTDATCPADFQEDRATNELARRWSLTGPRLTICSACCSTSSAILTATTLLRHKLCSRVIVGGAELLSWFDVNGFRSAKLLSPTVMRPFDRQRNGTMLGEGGALLLIEPPGRRPPFMRLLAACQRTETYDVARPEPSGDILRECIEQALHEAHLTPQQIDYVNAHGTATVANDASEAMALGRIWPRSLASTCVSSTKGMTGHLRGACGVVEALICALALGLEVAPPTTGCLQLDSAFEFDCVVTEPRRRVMNHAVSITRGFGGVNSALVLARGTNAGLKRLLS